MDKNLFVTLPDIYVDYIKRNREFKPAQHYHDKYEIYFQLAGKRKMFIDKKLWLLQSGCVSLISPFVLHHASSLDSFYHERYVINFGKEILKDIIPKEETEQLLSVFNNSSVMINSEVLPAFLYFFKNAHACTNEKLLPFYIYEILKIIANHSSQNIDFENGSKYEAVKNAVQFIEKNYADDLCVKDVAEYVHLSTFHFCRTFKDITGETFLQYLNATRLKNAHYLILNSDLSLSEIARLSGFYSGAHFTRVFKSKYNKTPREFKKSNK